MGIAGTVLGALAGRLLLPLLWRFEVPNSRSLRVLVLLFTTGSAALAGAMYGTTWDVLPVWLLFVALIGVSTVDLYHYRIPDLITYPTLAALLALMLLISLPQGEPAAIRQAAISAGIYFGVMYFLHVISHGDLGLGDVKLALPMGLVLGWLSAGFGEGLVSVLAALALGAVLGAVMGLMVKAMRTFGLHVLPDPMGDGTPSSAFPFGPSLAIGAAVSALVVAPAL